MKIKGRTTLKTLAKASGVSVATASQVIRGVGRISEHTRKRVLSTAEKMNYIPDGRAISYIFLYLRFLILLMQKLSAVLVIT